MKLQDNPFYILKLTCSACRRDIVSAAEEMSFVLDTEVCINAQNELINLAKRLTAELGWFIELSAGELDSIRESIGNGEIISVDELSSLSRLNATLFNFALSDMNDPFEIGYAILDIDEQYTNLDAAEIMDLINANRTTAKLALVQEQAVSEEINKKRDDIRQTVSERLTTLDQEAYIELVTMLAEKCIVDNDYNDGVVLSDIVDQYEIRMQSLIEESTHAIGAHIERMQKLAFDDAISNHIKSLIKQVKNWDRLVQPLQLKSQASGMPHKLSEQIGIKLRNLALFLHNEKGLTQEALEFVDAMKDVFVELGNLSDLFSTDAKALNDLLRGENDAKEVLAEMDALQKLSESIKSFPTSTNVDSFIDRVRKLDAKLKQLDLDAETRTKIRESLCYMARGTAIELHNTKHQTLYAFTIAKALVVEFSDMPSLRAKLLEDSTALSQQILLSNQSAASSRSTSNSDKTGCFRLLIIAVGILIIIAILSAVGRNSSRPPASSITKPPISSTAKPSPAYSSDSGTQAQTETRFSSNAVSGDKVYEDIVSIFPEIGIYTEGSSYYSYFVCRCKTSSGGTVWVYMTVSEYKSNFDSSASTSIFSQFADEVDFSSSKRIHGVAKNAENTFRGLSADTGTMVIDFSSLVG